MVRPRRALIKLGEVKTVGKRGTEIYYLLYIAGNCAERVFCAIVLAQKKVARSTAFGRGIVLILALHPDSTPPPQVPDGLHNVFMRHAKRVA